MKVGQWMRAALAGAAIAAASTRASAQADAPAAPSASPSPGQELRQYLDRLLATVNQGTQPQRDEAAQRLVDIGSPEARTIIRNVLQGNDDRAQNACAKAIAEGRIADPGWLASLVGMLTKDRTVDAAARALVRYDTNPLAYDPLIRLARLRQQSYRANIVRELGQVVQKPVADALVQIVSDTTEEPAVRAAAAEALADLSGQHDNGSDARKWQAWWTARNGSDPAAWRAQVLAEQHPALEHEDVVVRDRLRKFKSDVAAQFKDHYSLAAPADKPKMLLGLLNDPDPDMREIGAQVVSSAIGAGQPVPEEVHSRLIQLVGDASPDVRHQVVLLLKDLADPNALDAILTQLQVENTAQVKIDLLQAIARQQQNARAKAVPVIEKMLQDPSPRVAAEAATALRAMAPVIQADPAQAKQVFQDLLNVLQSRTGPPGMPNDEPGSDDLRAALAGAMASLATADPQDAMDVFQQLVNQNESPRVRRAAVQGLAPSGERSADIIAQELNVNNEPDPAVRQTAALALGQIGSFSYAQRLYDSMQRQVEPDQFVREAAWKAFQALLQGRSTTLQELYTWAELFHRQRDVDREVFVRKELARRLSAARDLAHLALEQQRIGEIYLLDLKQYTDAVSPLGDALDYWEQAHDNNQTVVRLIGELMQAYLKSGQFQKAIRFGEQEINRDPSNQDEIGPAIRNTASQLVDDGLKGDAASLRNAATLIGDALAMNPPLKEMYVDGLKSLRQTLNNAPAGP